MTAINAAVDLNPPDRAHLAVSHHSLIALQPRALRPAWMFRPGPTGLLASTRAERPNSRHTGPSR